MADVELNSIGNGDGTNYLVRDNTKIPLSGTNALAGSIVPGTDNAYNLGDSTYGFKDIYTNKMYLKGSTIFNVVDDNYICVGGATAQANGANLVLNGKNRSTSTGEFKLEARDGTNTRQLIGKPDGTLSWNGNIIPSANDAYNLGSSSYGFRDVITHHITIMSNAIEKATDDFYLSLRGSTSWNNGGAISVYGKNSSSNTGAFRLEAHNGTTDHYLLGLPNGTLTWSGQSIQYGSDARLKQQISQIDDDLLTAWKDVSLVQFKYNDAVDQKGKDKARLHTGYVVQQIDDACKSHNVDISKYGLYCHEEYAEETREVEQADGTKTIEVVRPANEHYSLRYTEALIVECAYLRKKNKDLQEQLNALSERLEKLENR